MSLQQFDRARRDLEDRNLIMTEHVPIPGSQFGQYLVLRLRHNVAAMINGATKGKWVWPKLCCLRDTKRMVLVCCEPKIDGDRIIGMTFTYEVPEVARTYKIETGDDLTPLHEMVADARSAGAVLDDQI
jgi:hypothetical protein